MDVLVPRIPTWLYRDVDLVRIHVSRHTGEMVNTGVELCIGVTNGTNGGIDGKPARFRKFRIV
jgi:hypothetical protein